MEKRQRITYRSVSPNPLFMQWLKEFKEDAVARGSQSQHSVNEAIKSLKRYPLPLLSGGECAILKGFGKGLCCYLDSKLKAHQEQGNTACNIANSKRMTLGHPSGISPQLIVRNERYKPRHRTGACALLLALLEHVQSNPSRMFLYKDELMTKAQPLCEESFWRRKPGTFYTAWASMTSLQKKGLVKSIRTKKAEYSLTDEGFVLATELYNEYKDIPTTDDLMDKDFGEFNKNVVNIGNDDRIPDNNIHVLSSDEEATQVTNAIQNRQILAKVNDDVYDSDDELPQSPASVPIGQDIDTNKEELQAEDCEMVDAENIIEMPSGCFDVVLLIDKQETSGGLNRKTDRTVIQFDKYSNLKHEYRHLKIGDFTWIARNRNNGQELVLPYIVERKRMDDLASSIKDGRYHEQKFRLKRCGLANVIYLIENYGGNKHLGLPLQTLLQAIANTRVQSGFKVHTTDSLASTVRFLAMMTKRLTVEFEDKTLMGLNKESSEFLMTFEYFNKASSKSKPLTVTETFIKMLLQLKSMSLEKALAITEVYKTPRSLIEKYKTCDQKAGEVLLANLRRNELSCKVGPSVSRSIYQLFSINVLQ